MVAVNFSLTEQLADIIYTYRASPMEDVDLYGEVTQFVSSEIIARVASVFISCTAMLDCIFHTASILYKVSIIGLYQVQLLDNVSYSVGEVNKHFDQVLHFAYIAAIGSIFMLVYPESMKSVLYTPRGDSGLDLSVPSDIEALFRRIVEGEITTPYTEVKDFWENATLEQKHWFVVLCTYSGEAESKAVKDLRQELATVVYTGLVTKGVKWEVPDELIRVHPEPPFFAGSYYHATSEDAVRSIITTCVEVRHQKAYRGAFVSTVPEDFGDFVLVFNRRIERLSELAHGFMGWNGYWAGFSKNIPVNEHTLEGICVRGATIERCCELERELSALAGFEIVVKPYSNRYTAEGEETKSAIKRYIHRNESGRPEEWPSDGEDDLQLTILSHAETLRVPVLEEPIAVMQREPAIVGEGLQHRQLALA